MSNYVKVVFGLTSGADNTFCYKVNEITEARFWRPKETDAKAMGGFSFGTEETILRWLIRGDTLYDVIIPDCAEVITIDNPSVPNGVFRTNKIVLTNPRVITDDMALSLYEKSTLPEKTYYKALAGLAIRGYINTAKKLIKDKINSENIDLVFAEFNDFVKPGLRTQDHQETYDEVLSILRQIKKEEALCIR